MKNEHLIQIDSETCVGCGLCVQDCPADNISLQKPKGKNPHAGLHPVRALRCHLPEGGRLHDGL